MNRISLRVVVFFFSLLAPMVVFAWGMATHVYLADHLGKSSGYWNYQEMYGATAPDLYKSLFGSAYYNYLESETHIRFEKVALHASGTTLKSFAFGFVSHNDVWGADFTSHHDGRTTPGAGYVSVQVEGLKAAFQDSIEQVLLTNNIDPEQAKAIAAEFAPSVAHIAVELAVDIFIKRNEDRNIGSKMIMAAQLRSSAIPGLLLIAYAADFAQEFDLSLGMASSILLGAEQGHRTLVTTYGAIFLQSEAEIVRRLSSYLSDLAELYLRVFRELKVSVPSTTAAALLKLTMAQIAPSYASEIASTLAYLKTEMPKHPTNGHDLAIDQALEITGTTGKAGLPDQFSLEQNWPNPFNPTTQIRYTLAAPGPVKLLVFNSIGQTVAKLVDDYQTAGVYQVTWDASHLPGGLYFCRLETETYRASRKMVLQK